MPSHVRRRIALWVLLWRAGPWRLVAVCALAVLQGLAPTAAILASGLLIGAVPEAVRQGPGSAGAHRAVLGLALFGTALLLGALVGAVADDQMQVHNGRYSLAVYRTVARSTLRTRGVAALEDPHVAGELAALEEFERAEGYVGTVTSVRELLRRRVSGIGAFVVLLSFAWWAPVVMMVGWRGLSVGVRRWLEHGIELDASIAATRLRRSRYLRALAMEAGAAKEVRVFGLADWLVSRYSESYLAALRALWAGRRLGMRTVVLATSGVLATHALVLGAIGWEAAAGRMTVAQVSVFGQAVLSTAALGYVFGVEVPLARSRQAAWRVLCLERRLIGREHAATGRTTRIDRRERPGSLSVLLRDVSFAYPGRETPTLHGLRLSIPAGQSVAIVGENGAGKSTLVKLLCGLYEPDTGVIELGGVAPSHALPHVAAIFQNFVRFELPLRVNVGFGDLAIVGDDLALGRVLADAGAGDLVDALPQGWDTVLSSSYPGGQDLSGGQWQKVALARALAAVRGGAGLLILDEPTASMDVRAEAELLDRVLVAARDVTTIVVSHRLASIRRADRIVLLAGGRVEEDGSHEQLMAAGGRYAEMFLLQANHFVEHVEASKGAGRDA